MSETALKAQALFDAPEQATRALDGLGKLDDWAVEESDIVDACLSVQLISASATFDPEKLISELRAAKPKVLTIDVFDNQTGESMQLAWKGGRKSTASTAFKALAAEVPGFAAAAAIEAGSLAKLRAALANGGDANTRAGGTTLLYLALEFGRSASVIKALLGAGADPNLRNSDGGGETAGRLPLPYACEHASLAIVRTLLAGGADVNAAESDGTTALHAASRKDARLISLLLEAGADLHAVDAEGFTPFLCGVAWGYSGSAVQALIDAGSDVEHVCNEGGNARWYAVEGVVRRIVEPLGLPLRRPGNGYDQIFGSPLSIAIHHKDTEKFVEHIPSADPAQRSEAAKWLFDYEQFDFEFARTCLPHVGYDGLAAIINGWAIFEATYPGQSTPTQRKMLALIVELRPDVMERLTATNQAIVSEMRASARRILEAVAGGASTDERLARVASAARVVPRIREAVEAIAEDAELIGGCLSETDGKLTLRSADIKAEIAFSRDGESWRLDWVSEG